MLLFFYLFIFWETRGHNLKYNDTGKTAWIYLQFIKPKDDAFF